MSATASGSRSILAAPDIGATATTGPTWSSSAASATPPPRSSSLPKGTERLRSIIEAYPTSGYHEVRYVVASPLLARRIIALARAAWLPRPAAATTPVVVVPWIDTPKDIAARIRRASGVSG